MSDNVLRRLKEQTPYTNVLDGELMKDAASAIEALRAENEKLRAAGEGVVKWWLDEGCLPFDGAPYALFALGKALGHSRAKAALKETGDD